MPLFKAPQPQSVQLSSSSAAMDTMLGTNLPAHLQLPELKLISSEDAIKREKFKHIKTESLSEDVEERTGSVPSFSRLQSEGPYY